MSFLLFCKFNLKVDFHLSVWLQERERERERENDHVSMCSLIIFLSHGKVFLSIWSREKVESSSTFSHQLNRKSYDNQSNKVIFANAALLLFLSTRHCFPIENQIFIFSFSVFLFPLPFL